MHKDVLGGLFHIAYMYAHNVRHCDYGVIEVNPRHAVFYRRTLFFELIGAERVNLRVNAPSVLLCVSFEKIRVELKKYFEGPSEAFRAADVCAMVPAGRGSRDARSASQAGIVAGHPVRLPARTKRPFTVA